MAQGMYLKGIERRVWMLYFDDGLLDISLGLLLLGIAISAWLPDFGVSASLQVPVLIALEFLAVLVLIGGKRLITTPRMGHVRYGRGRKVRKVKAVASIAMVTLVLLILLVVGTTVGDLLSWPSMGKLVRHIVIGAAMTAVISCMAYFLHFARGYIHGVLYGLAFSTSFYLDTPIIMAVAAVVILLIGLAVLLRFLREYPMASTEMPGSEG